MTAGIEQFREGNYPLAREHFERSLALGADTPALRYNLGVVCYKTGDYAAARNHFSTLLNGDSQALARYNLGLVALAEGRTGQARDWFGQAAADDAPDKVRQLAERQLADLSVQDNASRQQSTLARQGYLSAGLGYDSNMAGCPRIHPVIAAAPLPSWWRLEALATRPRSVGDWFGMVCSMARTITTTATMTSRYCRLG